MLVDELRGMRLTPHQQEKVRRAKGWCMGNVRKHTNGISEKKLKQSRQRKKMIDYLIHKHGFITPPDVMEIHNIKLESAYNLLWKRTVLGELVRNKGKYSFAKGYVYKE